MAGKKHESDSAYLRATLLGLGLLLVLRIGFLVAAPLNLYADEAQYWRWGETLDWGYYSKPPMIAWVIHAVTALFGNGEWAVRLAAPFLHTTGAVFLFLLGRAMYDARTGMFAAFGYALMPAVILSSAVISTDGVLMPFWCAGLYAFWRLRSGEGRWASAVGLGVAVGAGFLSKYAMLYFLIGTGLTLVLDKDTRRALVSWRGLVALLVAAAIFAPHMAWNAANDFKTVSHTVDNANLGGELFHPEHALDFLVDQMGVFGPISLISLVFGLLVMRRSDEGLMGRDRWLLCFVIPVLVIILAQAVISRANANWAVTAWPAASVLVAAWLIRAQPNRSLWFWIAGLTFVALLLAPDLDLWLRVLIGGAIAASMLGFGHYQAYRPAGLLWANLTAHALLALFFVTVALLPADMSTELGFDNAQKRTRGWDIAAADVFQKAAEMG
ncbi:ArnT family glycosyltransferase, partial [Hyphomonas sp.]|uniref:ArnT family glycosyltransferase n=1 Tax=Hyphomonas sp. TaxID=87 RepID=UPI0039E3641E